MGAAGKVIATSIDHSFLQGFALAVAELARNSGADNPTAAANLIAGFGFDLADFRRAKVDGYDLRVISKLYKTESALKRDAYAHLKR